jgi:hypothetical protein
MPRMSTQTFGTGDQSWLGSAHNIRNARTEQVNVSAFTAGTHYPNGYIPSGTPVAKVGGLLVPYDSLEATTTGAGVLAGTCSPTSRSSGPTTSLPRSSTTVASRAPRCPRASRRSSSRSPLRSVRP